MKLQGFTLIELMVVIFIVGILVTIAFPSYNEYITRTRRSDGHTALMDLASRLERYYSEHNTYATARINSGNAVDDVLGSDRSTQGWYTLSITEQGPANYTIQATPRNAQERADQHCANLTYNSLGQKGFSGSTGSLEQCW
ncbi:MAG: type IV pilin protein [Legionellaceae bacterium]|nr:type IV pilin protein [Legionellaceae bacterium]